jgi:ribosome recycling factor
LTIDLPSRRVAHHIASHRHWQGVRVIDDTLFEAEEKMEKAVSVAKDDFAAIRTGRAHPGMFAKVVVEYYGAITPLNQLAGFTVADARMIVINPYDKASLRAIEKAIRDSDLGVNPTDDGNVIRVSVPQLTEERRRDYIKLARGQAEEAKVSIRNIRRHAKEALDKLGKDGDAGEDDVHRAEKELDETTHRYVAQIEEVLRHKEIELLEV